MNFPPKMEVFYWIVSGFSLNLVAIQMLVSRLLGLIRVGLHGVIVHSQVDTSVNALVIV